ncbi:spore coat associated protein CotJA [Hominifimenecus sp. rT4P-3]|uniref:spore coat associated protein CotJA n=1 Tax=Hominifimenecus sp. rT4P-3 TaxID=3242979 RepID=UPI003DA5B761
MSYSPDYSMRRRNQDCGCRRPQPQGPAAAGCGRNRQPQGTCGCANKPEMPMPGCNVRPMPRTPEMPVLPDCIDSFPVGMTYVPWQRWQNIYDVDHALMVGTIFQDLDYPWMVGGGCGAPCR